MQEEQKNASCQQEEMQDAYIAEICDINQYPEDLQDEVLNLLIAHFCAFPHLEHDKWAERDVQHAGVLLYWSLSSHLESAGIAEHAMLFGTSSAEDVESIVAQIQKIRVSLPQ